MDPEPGAEGEDPATLLAHDVFNVVRRALVAAEREARRAPPSIEAEGIDRVIHLARDLRCAIEQSSLPAGWSRVVEVPSQTEPIDVALGWRDIDPKVAFAAPLAIVDVLETAIALANEHREKLPSRLAVRDRGSILRVVFVRHLHRELRSVLGLSSPTTVGRIATAVLGLDEPLDKAAVDGILRDAPGR